MEANSLWNKSDRSFLSRRVIDKTKNDLFNNVYLRNNNKNPFRLNPRDIQQVLDVRLL